MSLTQNGIQSLLVKDSFSKLVLQVIDIQQLPSEYFVTLSDGVHKTKCSLGSGLDKQINDGLIQKYSIVKVTDGTVKGGAKPMPVILKMGLLSNADSLIGNPSNFQTQEEGIKTQQSRATNVVQPQAVSSKIIPIKDINIYEQRLHIKATLTSMGDIRTWQKSDKTGKVCSIDLADDSGEIRMTLFTEAIDQFQDILAEGKVYYISGGKIQHRNKKFNQLNHPCEITSTANTHIQLAEDQNSTAQIHFNFVPLERIKDLEEKASCDAIGRVVKIEDTETIVSKRTGQQLLRRNVQIADKSAPGNSRKDVVVTLWGDKADNINFQEGSVIALKGARKSAFSGGHILTTFTDTRIFVDPQTPEAEELAMWDASQEDANVDKRDAKVGGGAGHSRETVPLGTVETEGLGRDKTDFLKVRAEVTNFSEKGQLWYEACPSEKCNKKVIRNDDTYYCPGCAGTYKNFQLRYSLGFQIGDYSSKQWITAFDETSQIIVGKTAAELSALKEENEDVYKEYLNERKFIPLDMTLRASTSQADGTEYAPKLRLTLVRCAPVQNKSAIQEILQQIKTSIQ